MKNFNENDLLYPGDDILVKKYRTDNEVKIIKRFLKAVAIVICLAGLALMLFANDLIYLFPLVWLAVPVAIIKRNRKPELGKQRKRITKKLQSRDKKREHRRKIEKIQSRNSAIKADEERKEALAIEMAIVDERLKKALKPIVWDSPAKQDGVWSKRKPLALGAQEKSTVTQLPSRKPKRAIKRDFKFVSVDNI